MDEFRRGEPAKIEHMQVAIRKDRVADKLPAFRVGPPCQTGKSVRYRTAPL